MRCIPQDLRLGESVSVHADDVAVIISQIEQIDCVCDPIRDYKAVAGEKIKSDKSAG